MVVGRRGAWLVSIAIALGSTGCGLLEPALRPAAWTWHRVFDVRATPRVVLVDHLPRAEVLQILVRESRRLGYAVDEFRPEKGAFQVRAFRSRRGDLVWYRWREPAGRAGDPPHLRRGDVFYARVEEDGSFVIAAGGDHVTLAGRMPLALRLELDRYVDHLETTIRQRRP